MEYIDHISLLDIKDKKVLLCLSRGKNKWQLPGGKREMEEKDEQTLIRECKEELNVDVIPDSIKLFETIEGQAFGKENGIIVRIKMFTAVFTGDITPTAEVEQARYMNFSEVPNTSEMGWKYLTKLQKKGLID